MSDDFRARNKAAASYHPSGYGTSPSLQRARQPFVTRNLLTGGAIVGFAVWIYWYSISAVKQDDFADIADLLPSQEERKSIKSIEDEAKERLLSKKEQYSAASSSSSTPSPLSTPIPAPAGLPTLLPVISPLPAPAKEKLDPYRAAWLRLRSEGDGNGWVVNGRVDVDRVGRMGDDGVLVGDKRLV